MGFPSVLAHGTLDTLTMSFDREQMQEQAASLAVQGVYLGTSSRSYESWMGRLYTTGRHEYRGNWLRPALSAIA